MDGFSNSSFVFGVIAGVGLAYLMGWRPVRKDGAAEVPDEPALERALTSLTPDVRAQVDECLHAKKKIAAIKVLREATGLGLRDAKLTVELRQKQLSGIG